MFKYCNTLAGHFKIIVDRHYIFIHTELSRNENSILNIGVGKITRASEDYFLEKASSRELIHSILSHVLLHMAGVVQLLIIVCDDGVSLHERAPH